MNKKNREFLLHKYGGKCSYCGTDIVGTKWHADHAEPVLRKTKRVDGGWFWRESGIDALKPTNHNYNGREQKHQRIIPSTMESGRVVRIY